MKYDEEGGISESEVEWEIWHQDTFEMGGPRRIERVGRGLAEGLIELWARHLQETVRADGRRGFSTFNLWWKREGRTIEVAGEWEGQVRLRNWIYGGGRPGCRGYAEGGRELLEKVALAHRDLILGGETSEGIVAAAIAAENREDFDEELL
jgi:hypothetical protein